MLASTNQTDTSLISLGAVFHNAALTAQAAIDAIPEDAEVVDEMNVIDLASAPVNELARLILRTPCNSSAGEATLARATAWMEGVYFSTVGAAA